MLRPAPRRGPPRARAPRDPRPGRSNSAGSTPIGRATTRVRAAAMLDRPGLRIHPGAEQPLRREEEGVAPAVGVEADDVVGQQTLVHRFAQLAGERMPVVRLGATGCGRSATSAPRAAPRARAPARGRGGSRGTAQPRLASAGALRASPRRTPRSPARSRGSTPRAAAARSPEPTRECATNQCTCAILRRLFRPRPAGRWISPSAATAARWPASPRTISRRSSISPGSAPANIADGACDSIGDAGVTRVTPESVQVRITSGKHIDCSVPTAFAARRASRRSIRRRCAGSARRSCGRCRAAPSRRSFSIGRDTRESGGWIEAELAHGACGEGASVDQRRRRADAGGRLPDAHRHATTRAS